MLNGSHVAGLFLSLLCGSFLFASSTRAEPPATPDAAADTPIKDVALTSKGVLEGRVLNAEGRLIDGVVVTLRDSDEKVGQTTTDRDGVYRFQNVVTGVYQIEAANRRCVFRAWPNTAAPPSAQDSATIVLPTSVVRGQSSEVPACDACACGQACDAGPWGYSHPQAMNQKASGVGCDTTCTCVPPNAGAQHGPTVGGRGAYCERRTIRPGIGAGFGIAGTALGITGTVVGAIALGKARNSEEELEDVWDAIYYLSP